MKETIIINTIYFIVVYILVCTTYIFFINRKRKTYKEGKKEMDINYIVNKFNLDMRKVNYKTLKWGVTFINPFIIATTFVAVINIENMLISMLLGFVIMMMLIYSCYEIFGRILKKKGEKNYV